MKPVSRHSCESGNPQKYPKQILAYARMTQLNEQGLTMILGLVALLVLFTTFTLIKVSSLDSLQPDLRRIGINVGADATPNPLADTQTSNPSQISVEDATESLSIVSDELNIGATIDSEGDTPLYIE